MKYKIDWVEKKVGRSGKEFYVMSLTDEQGKQTLNVTTFDSVQAGMEIEGEIVQKGEYLNFMTKKQEARSNFASNRKEEMIGKAQDRKEQMIVQAQERKESSIAFFNATNSAIALLAVSVNKPATESDCKAWITKWRSWFLEEWKTWEAKPLTDKTSAF